MGIIYKHTNRLNSKSYIGQTVQPIERRKATGYSHRFQNALDKYGWDNFDTTVLFEGSDNELNYWEIYFIALYDTYRTKGYNSTKGGNGARGFKQSETSKLKKAKAVCQFDLEGNLIKEFPGQAWALRETGIRHITECVKGDVRHAGGFIWVYKKDINLIKEKIKQYKNNYRGRLVEVIQFDSQDNYIATYKTASEASKITGVNAGHISECAKNKKMYHTAGGYKWRYGNENFRKKI